MDRLRRIENTVIGLEVRYLPHELGEQVTQAMLRQQSAHSFLSEITKRHIPVIEVTMTAINAPKWLAKDLGLKRGAAVRWRGNCFRDWREAIAHSGRCYLPRHVHM